MIKNVVFDIGAVLVDWNPRYYYRKIMASEAEIDYFLTHVFTFDWNHSLDLGRPWDEARAELVARYPTYTPLIDAYWKDWLEMCAGPIHESVDILMDIKRRGYPVYALSNWNAIKFQDAIKEFPFLRLFDGRIISGDVKLAKPDPRIYHCLLDTYQLNPRECLFIDDRMENVQAARDIGIEAVQFTSPRQLESDLVAYGIFPPDEEIDDNDDDDAASMGGCGSHCTCHS